MIKNYLKIAFRNLLKQRFYSVINVLGLAIGLAVCLLIALFVLDEMSYDRYHTNADQIYRVRLSYSLGGQSGDFPIASAPLARTMAETYPEVENAVRFRAQGNYTVYRDDRAYQEEDVTYADSTLFTVFDIPLLHGNPETALTEMNSLVLCETSVEKYFGADWEQNPPLGETLLLGRDKTPYKITGIFEEIPTNSHFHFDVFLSMVSLKDSQSEIWLSNNYYTYLLLREDANVTDVEEKLNETFETYGAPQLEQYANASYEDFIASGNYFNYLLQPLTDIHLHSDLEHEIEANGDIRYVYIFSAIALFVLLIACFNFMNLSTARSAGRAKEVGIRKTLGSIRQQLITQFLAEALLVSFLALLLAILFAEVAIPFFNDLAGKQLTINYLQTWYFIPLLLLAVTAIGLLAGSYPAFFLSAFRPASVLKGKLATKSGGRWLRNGLVVLQFGISITLITSTVVVYQQLNHIRNKKLGYDKEHVLVLHNTFYLNKQAETFKNEALRQPGVTAATLTGHLPADPFNNNNNAIFPDNNPESDQTTTAPWFSVDYDYIPTMGMNIATGRNFSRDFATDSTAMIINEAAAKYFFGEDDPLGHKLSNFGEEPGSFTSYTVVGVVEDFHYSTLRQKIMPMVMIMGNSISALSLRVQPEQVTATIAALEDQWNRFQPDLPFEYSFLDERFDNIYQAEQRLGTIFTIFCSLAIFIACLGLFGLAAYTAEQRTKEIGIRKVMGASVSSLVVSFSKDFTKLVLVALLVAIPTAYFLMNQWLADFAYRISLGASTFIIAGGIALLIAWLTISFQSIRAAVANPVDSLRNE
ncbi:ABC transporter permease [Tunicatimonas pelagia]|uniref:ABC transporter permease n=1 Tax=Tunicatimonas pelagia TaxID=931531 RepID=UPI0026652418|nr:ABC transporter permease [Tunicatimonas pelagia]WKN41008.1 ABC transporter permease [Tunicatimonas pelagia]